MNTCPICMKPSGFSKKNKEKIFCSYKCSGQSKKKGILSLCTCGKEIYVRPSQPEKKFCSLKCMASTLKTGSKKKNGKYIPCSKCGKERYFPLCLIHNTKKGKKYCSIECKKSSMKEGEAGYGFKKIPKKTNYKKYYPYRIKTVKGVRMKEHRWVMEQYLKRKLESHEFIHHINGDTRDNRIENLMIVDNSAHGKIEFQSNDRLYS